jgi:hypothetical protein
MVFVVFFIHHQYFGGEEMGKSSPAVAGLAVFAGLIVGVVAFLAGILAVFNEYDYVGAGLCFLASAFAFGLLANAIYRE